MHNFSVEWWGVPQKWRITFQLAPILTEFSSLRHERKKASTFRHISHMNRLFGSRSKCLQKPCVAEDVCKRIINANTATHTNILFGNWDVNRELEEFQNNKKKLFTLFISLRRWHHSFYVNSNYPNML